MAPKPTFAVLPGAFYVDECLGPLVQQLNEAEDVSYIRDMVLLPLLEEGRDVVTLLHSYAGFPGSVAIKGLGKTKRAAQGLKGGIVGIVYMCAFVPVEGLSLKATLGTGLLMVPDPIPVFYQDAPEELAKSSAALVKGHSIKSMMEAPPPLGFADAAYDGRRAYIKALNDKAIPPFAQNAIVEGSGVKWTVKKIEVGHSPFLAKPRELSVLLGELASTFTEVA